MSTFTKETLQAGSGPSPQKGQMVTVSADLYLKDGMKGIWSTHKPQGFLFSAQNGPEPFSYKSGVGGVIRGWDDGVATSRIVCHRHHHHHHHTWQCKLEKRLDSRFLGSTLTAPLDILAFKSQPKQTWCLKLVSSPFPKSQRIQLLSNENVIMYQRAEMVMVLMVP